MRSRTLAPFALAVAGFVVAPLALATPVAGPLCGDHVKKPSGDTEKPPKASTDPLCGDGVKKPTDGDSEKPPKS